MLENSMTKNPQAVEEVFCKPFSSIGIRPMTAEESSSLLMFSIADKRNSDESIIGNTELPFAIQIMRKRIETSFTFQMTEPLELFVGLISGSAGNVIMYLTYLQYRAKKMDKKILNIEDFCNIFSLGLPNDEGLHRMWENQKVKHSETNPIGSDNLLDYNSAMESINFKL